LTVKTIAEVPAKGGASVTPAPLHTNPRRKGLTSPYEHGSLAVPAPRYSQPSDPAGFPSPRQFAAGSATVIDGEAPPVSTICSEPPVTLGSPAGRSKRPRVGHVTSCASWPGRTSCSCPGISSSSAWATAALAKAMRHARATRIPVDVRRI